MKKIHFLIILLLTSCSNLKYLDAFDGFKNKPKEVESSKFKVYYTDSLSKEELGYKFRYSYDLKGKRINRFFLKPDDSPIDGDWIFSYDKYGNQIQNILYNIDGSIKFQINDKYNKHGQLIESVDIRNGKKSTAKYVFDRKRRLCYLTGKNKDGSFINNTITKFDERWREIELTSYDDKGKLEIRIEYQYDERGNMTISKWYNSKNELYNISKTIFNKKMTLFCQEDFT